MVRWEGEDNLLDFIKYSHICPIWAEGNRWGQYGFSAVERVGAQGKNEAHGVFAIFVSTAWSANITQKENVGVLGRSKSLVSVWHLPAVPATMKAVSGVGRLLESRSSKKAVKHDKTSFLKITILDKTRENTKTKQRVKTLMNSYRPGNVECEGQAELSGDLDSVFDKKKIKTNIS